MSVYCCNLHKMWKQMAFFRVCTRTTIKFSYLSNWLLLLDISRIFAKKTIRCFVACRCFLSVHSLVFDSKHEHDVQRFYIVCTAHISQMISHHVWNQRIFCSFFSSFLDCVMQQRNNELRSFCRFVRSMWFE